MLRSWGAEMLRGLVLSLMLCSLAPEVQAFQAGFNPLPQGNARSSSRSQTPGPKMALRSESMDRRSALGAGLMAAAFSSLDPSAAGAATKERAGGWARHTGSFTDEELEGFTVTKSGLKVKDIVEGTGPIPQPGQKIKAHYSGYLLEGGKKFDSSYDRGQPLAFKVGVGQVIKGWDEGLLSMKVGGKRELIIPAELAYGARNVGNGLIPANSALVFYVELVTLAA
mmetsp:Transcript_29466/g.46211  ORF Transcript_29466/g.46211 Transcript_29466/m.46211 type:complete len:225 (+) Transcript_29466:32-706(+)|eukprot:CAMPEP_0184326996 /NCGR_PEP_ID=MMETSP1049-20130417/142861_1 /TAXON_ID=77928 /ORGANISM="Proteomonas sulcata, Strain CCMP704" /LENGTH=224 /DNA_ID=CAMNT_0026649227 /DNA_START=477 /DNA_END=1151 /DNA_ORIENTATION=-